MKRKAGAKRKQLRARRPAKRLRGARPAAAAPPAEDGEAALLAAGMRALDLPLDPAWRAGVAFNLRLILQLAARVDEFALADDVEPAPVFHA